MNTHTAPPTGRRKITPPQLRAEAAGGVPVPPSSPGRALAAFKRAAAALGVPRRVVDLIDGLMSYSPAQDWDGGPGLGPIVWPSDAELEDRLCVGPSQRKVIVRAALDAGFIRLRRSPTGKRWGHRDKGGRGVGRIVDAYGFDLVPLAERMAEFERMAAEWEARREEGRRLRREITSTRNHVLSLVDLAVAQDLDSVGWPGIAEQADALWRERGAQRDPLPLVPIAARLRALCVHVQEQVTAALAAVEVVENAPTGPEYRPHLTTTNQLLIASANTSALADDKAGPDRPIAGQEKGSDGQLDQPVVQQQPRVGPTREIEAQPSALRGFVVTPGFILLVAPAFRDWVGNARAGWDDLDQAAGHVRSALGISPHAWGQACIALGLREAVTTLAAISARHAAGQVRSPGGLLRKMVELHQTDGLRLDRTLFGLAEKVDGGRRRNAGVDSRPAVASGDPHEPA